MCILLFIVGTSNYYMCIYSRRPNDLNPITLRIRSRYVRVVHNILVIVASLCKTNRRYIYDLYKYILISVYLIFKFEYKLLTVIVLYYKIYYCIL